MSDCRFGVSPVNYPDPDPDPETGPDKTKLMTNNPNVFQRVIEKRRSEAI